MGWHFRVGERLALVLVPSRRDVEAGSSQVLKRIGIGQPRSNGKVLPSPSCIGIGVSIGQVPKG